MCVRLNYLFSIDENFVNGQYNMDRTVLSFMIFLPYPGLESRVARFKGRCGSSAEDTGFTMFKWIIWFLREIWVGTVVPPAPAGFLSC